VTAPPDTLPEYLRWLRGDDSQEKAAAQAKTTRRQWIGWESEGKGISSENARKIARGFKRPLAEVEAFVRARSTSSVVLAALERVEALFREIEERVASLEHRVDELDDPPAPQVEQDADR
jgi:hypothetical protein